MMKIIIPSILLLLSPNNLKPILLMLSFILMAWLMSFPHNNLFMMSSNLFFTDILSFSMITLTLMSLMLIFISSFNFHSIFTLMMLISYSLLLSFSSSNTLMFYIFFETVLIPTVLLITMKGKSMERIQAGIYLLLYTIFGSLPLLISLIYMKISSFLLIYPPETNPNWPIFFLMAFLIKLPMFSSHLWLPKAHVEAPLEGSMVLAAVLLKLGGYGIIRMIPHIHFMSSWVKSLLISISLIGALITSMNCIRQKDMKALIAYSSVSHMGMVLCALLSFKSMGLNAAILMMLAHGLTSSALFFLITIMYQYNHSRNILMLKGLLLIYPNLTFWWFMFSILNMSAPPSINMMSEVLIFSSLCQLDLMNILPIFLMSLATASFSIFLYSNISYSTNIMFPISTPPHHKSFLSLLSHFIPLIFMFMKPEMFSIIY